MADKLRILIHDRSGHPFQVQLSRELASRNHRVLHSYGAFFQTPKGSLTKKLSDPMNFFVEGINLDESFAKYSPLKRRSQERKYAKLLVEQVKNFQPDVVIFSNVPPDAQFYVYKNTNHISIKRIFWVQDLYAIAIARILNSKILGLGTIIGNWYSYQEKALLKQSDAVVLITEDFFSKTDAWNISRDKLHVIHNWSPLDEVLVKEKNNPWSVKHSLVDKFCIVYSGTLGLKHNPRLLLQLAVQFKDKEQVRVIVISEGLGADWLAQQKEKLALDNLILFSFQPFEVLPDVLASADILTAILEPDAGIYSVPSKVLTYLCTQRPLLLAVPPENLSARIVTQYQAGLVVPPDDLSGFISAAQTLLYDNGLRQQAGVNARRYAEMHFDIKTIGDKFEQIVLS